MSFSLTTPQFQAFSKDVTRRLGWLNLKPGMIVMGVVKAMGLKRGEKVQKLHAIRIVSNRPEPLSAITQADVVREGFPTWTPEQFIAMFCEHNNCTPDEIVNRIVFDHLDEPLKPIAKIAKKLSKGHKVISNRRQKRRLTRK